MPRSMTGFGRAEIKNGRFEIMVEIRSLNNRYLDIGLKLPKSLNTYEYLLKELTKKKILRGKLTVIVNFKNLVLENGDFRLNHETVQFYHQLLEKIKTQTGIADKITLDHLLQFKELIEPEDAVFEDNEIESVLTDAFEKALNNLDTMRKQEADNICTDIYSRLEIMKTILNSISAKVKDSPRLELDKLYNRLQEKINKREVDKDRLELELAIIADRVDVTEECTRLYSHLDLFKDVLDNKDEVGKQLTFLLQEMHRETNTIGSKTSDISISHEMIRLKEEIEKLREQVQNLE
jgi:uncharacterized protein (TIGR00255 family)